MRSQVANVENALHVKHKRVQKRQISIIIIDRPYPGRVYSSPQTIPLMIVLCFHDDLVSSMFNRAHALISKTHTLYIFFASQRVLIPDLNY